MSWLPVVLGALVLALAGLQLAVWLSTRRLEGRPAPPYGDLVDPALSERRQLVFYFHSAHCGPCQQMTPVMRELAAQSGNVVMVDVGEDNQLCCRFGVTAVPSVVVVEDGAITHALVGRQPPKRLARLAGA
jgi:thiol-disulfide isomerase/thioredoxin